MCTLIVGVAAWPQLPLLVAANRDEQLTRASEGFALREERPIPVYAPRDGVAGGTWLGLNAAGVFAAITNRAGKAPDPERRSRGRLVDDALGHANARTGAAALARIDPADYNPFHLVVADRDTASLVWADGVGLHVRELSAGLHVITERSFDAAPTRRPQLVREHLDTITGRDYPGAAWFQRLLSIRDVEAPLEGIAVHDPALGYGTRSSTVLELRTHDVRLFDHPGAPVSPEHPDAGWVDRSASARALLGLNPRGSD